MSDQEWDVLEFVERFRNGEFDGQEAKSAVSLAPGGAARRSPNRATGGAAGDETTRFPVVSPRVSVSAADHTIS